MGGKQFYREEYVTVQKETTNYFQRPRIIDMLTSVIINDKEKYLQGLTGDE